MKKLQVILLFAIMLCLVFPQAGFAKDTKMTGKFASVAGTVEVQKGKGKKKFEAVRNMGFTQGDTIFTRAKSKAVLHVDKNKEVTVAANTKLVVKQLVSSIDAKSDKASFHLVGGKVKVKINEKLQGNSKFEVQTPNAIMGVMGTEFDVAYDGENTYVGVSEGVVRADLPSLEEPVELRPNEFLQIDADGTAEVKAFGPAEHQFFVEESSLAREAAVETLAAQAQDEMRYDVARPEENDDDDDDDVNDANNGSSNTGDYQQGYDDGYAFNFNIMSESAEDHGYYDGYANGTPNRDYIAGWNDGYDDGLVNGMYDEGYGFGYEHGYEHGLTDYDKTISTIGETDEEMHEYDRGWSDGGSAGFQDGKAQNIDDYNAGYEQGVSDMENAGYDEGYADGEDAAYNEGWDNGWDDGYDEGQNNKE